MAARQYYVYTLADPRDNKPFYVGKGKGNRIDAHEKEALAGSNHPKCKLIREIREAGLEIIKTIVKWFANEDAAYKYEKRLIKKIGRHNLTNKTDGGKGAPAWVVVDDSSNDKESLDKTFAQCIFMMMRKTANFTREPVMYIGGRFIEIDGLKFDSFVEAMKKKLYEFHVTYGDDWLKKEAAKEKINLSFI